LQHFLVEGSSSLPAASVACFLPQAAAAALRPKTKIAIAAYSLNEEKNAPHRVLIVEMRRWALQNRGVAVEYKTYPTRLAIGG
jgi:hypothetical protein